MSNLSIYGHSYTRVFRYTEGGKYHELPAPGGAELLAKLLSVTTPQEIAGERRKLHAELQRFEGKNGQSYYAISRRMGFTEGEDVARYENESADTLIWDEGLGGLTLSDLEDGIGATLWASNKALPNKEQFAPIAANCFLILDADVLRGAGAMISRQISWERTATELIWQLQNNPSISYLIKAPRILVTFAEDGAVYIRRENGELKATLTLTHGGGEGSLREKLRGETDDAFILMTASLAEQFSCATTSGGEPNVLAILKTAEALMTTGLSLEGLKNGEYTLITKTEEAETDFAIPIKPGENAFDSDSWCIANSVSNKRVFDTAFQYVLEGAKVIEGLPQLSFGALTTVDRFEIEAYQNIRNLIVGYAADKSVRPLSIAVFGSPGSGKSFGVTQIAKNVLPGKVEKLEFNVSQFTALADLGAAFQKVRDVILQGKLPLVFFDEFDSDKDGLPLGWVKTFLMPMQDGKFKDESGEHPLGKCILVFAGGTAASFAEFTAPIQSDKPEESTAFKNIKGPDFVSRLKGTINVLGPNPKDESDKNYILRRALLLRSLCERKLNLARGVAPVSKNIIWAMLLVPEYKHGARSMEAILDMSRLEGNVWEPVSLPFYSQLALHVDADAFVKLVLREVILNSYVEKLAIAIHEDFCKMETERGHKDAAYNISWEQLPEDIKDSNRAQAASFAEKLNFIGYDYDAGDTPFLSVKKFDQETVLLLAQNEHIRWMNQKIASDWNYGSVRDNEKKIHPLLVPWENLPEEEKQKDIDVANNIIPLLESIGLRVFKTM
jgi:hypothetical protein